MDINTLKNKFNQEEFGACVPTCLANIFDAPKFIEDWKGGDKKGINYTESKKLIELYTEDWETPQSLNVLLYSTKRVDNYVPLFDLDQEDIPKDTFMVFMAGIRKEPRHCILLIKQNGSDDILILDPDIEHPNIIDKHLFFKEYEVYELEVLSTVETDGVSFFPTEFFYHLKYKK